MEQERARPRPRLRWTERLDSGTCSGRSDSHSALSSQKINRTPSDEECFFDLLSKFQSSRMDDQRCPLEECPAEAAEAAATRVPALGERICEHRCVPSPVPGSLMLLLWFALHP